MLFYNNKRKEVPWLLFPFTLLRNPLAYSLFFPMGRSTPTAILFWMKKIDLLLQKRPSMIVFDLQKLEYISSMGIRVLIKTIKAMKKMDGSVRYVNLKPEIKKVFDIVNVMPEQTIFSSVGELDNYLTAMQNRVKRGEIE